MKLERRQFCAFDESIRLNFLFLGKKMRVSVKEQEMREFIPESDEYDVLDTGMAEDIVSYVGESVEDQGPEDDISRPDERRKDDCVEFRWLTFAR